MGLSTSGSLWNISLLFWVESVREFCILNALEFYECVLFTAASIMGPREQYVHQGSTVTLTCVVPSSIGSTPTALSLYRYSGHIRKEWLRNISCKKALSRYIYIYICLKRNIWYMHVMCVLLHFTCFVCLYVLPLFFQIFSLSLSFSLSFLIFSFQPTATSLSICLFYRIELLLTQQPT